MSLFSKFFDVIECRETDYLVWKWRPSGENAKKGREDAIRYGSSIRVREKEVAVFIFDEGENVICDYIEGPYNGTLETENIPVLADMVGAVVGGLTPVRASVYFVNLDAAEPVKFAVPFFDIFDNATSVLGIPVAVRGSITFRIEDYQGFVNSRRLEDITVADFKKQVKDLIIQKVKEIVGNAPEEYGIAAVQIERKIQPITEQCKAVLDEKIFEKYGMAVTGLDISAIEVNKQSEAYRRLLNL